MKLFAALYDKMMIWSRHRYAPYYLASLSFAESSVFPIPPDVMLAPMALAQPTKAWLYAILTTVSSVLGGIFGYMLGMFFFGFIQPYLLQFGYESMYLQIIEWFKLSGGWIIFIAGFSPIPYKLFTVAAGVVGMPILPFIIASAIGRGARFFLVSGLILWGGAKIERLLKNYVDRLGWGLLFILVLAYLISHRQNIIHWIGLA